MNFLFPNIIKSEQAFNMMRYHNIHVTHPNWKFHYRREEIQHLFATNDSVPQVSASDQAMASRGG